MNLKKAVGSRLKICRQILFPESLQEDFAKLLSTTDVSVSKQNISDWETGKSTVSIQVQKRLFELGINISWLVAGEGSMFADNEAGRSLQAKNQPSKPNVELIGNAENLIKRHLVTESELAVIKSIIERVEKEKSE